MVRSLQTCEGHLQSQDDQQDSAHAAYFKGAESFKIKLVMVAVGTDYRLSGKAVRKAVTRNSILFIASLPRFSDGPH